MTKILFVLKIWFGIITVHHWPILCVGNPRRTEKAQIRSFHFLLCEYETVIMLLPTVCFWVWEKLSIPCKSFYNFMCFQWNSLKIKLYSYSQHRLDLCSSNYKWVRLSFFRVVKNMGNTLHLERQGVNNKEFETAILRAGIKQVKVQFHYKL